MSSIISAVSASSTYNQNTLILIVDDESDIRFLLKRFFIANKYIVKEAENLKKGIQLF